MKKNKKNQRAVKTAQVKKENKIKHILIKIIKWIIIISIVSLLAVFFFTSPVFNIKEIEIKGNNKIEKQTIIDLSEIQKEQNIYKFSKDSVKQKIKSNAYIDDVEVYRILPDKVEIEVKERKASFMIKLENEYAYINNQGYILEINKEDIFLPLITGYTTESNQIIAGNRLNDEDLKKFEKVLTIMEAAVNNNISELISEIDISDSENYTLVLNNENKKVYLGDASNITTRLYYLKGILQKEKGIKGEVFINGNLTTQKVFFREDV